MRILSRFSLRMSLRIFIKVISRIEFSLFNLIRLNNINFFLLQICWRLGKTLSRSRSTFILENFSAHVKRDEIWLIISSIQFTITEFVFLDLEHKVSRWIRMDGWNWRVERKKLGASIFVARKVGKRKKRKWRSVHPFRFSESTGWLTSPLLELLIRNKVSQTFFPLLLVPHQFASRFSTLPRWND